MKADYEMIHLAVMPPVETPAPLIRSVSEIVAQPDYQVRLLLAGRLPRIIAHYPDEPPAVVALKALANLGLTVFTIADAELRQPVSPELFAHSVRIEGNQATFTSHDGRTMTLKDSDVLLLLTGRRAGIPWEEPAAQTRVKLNLPATLATVGIPIMKRVAVEQKNAPEETVQQFIRLYDFRSDIPAVEIRQSDFDYSFLGSRMGLSAAANIGVAVTVLRECFNGSYFDDALLSGFQHQSRSISGIDKVEENCLLLARYYRTLANQSE
ncbi:hypothetical protein ABFB09_03240 [Dehalogenimonas sp. THU2]|uniref:hypothetical protein n=1 Tax=Dehalogenimonas sp. THU2 TaxID=3151121 RepID=UPI00321819AC